jgi:hypothetical protein
MSDQEAAHFLGVTVGTIWVYKTRGHLQVAGRGFVIKESVEKYAANRDIARRNISLQANRDRKFIIDHREWVKDRILKIVKDAYRTKGRPPIYDEIAPLVPMAKSGMSRYIPFLVKEGKLEIVGKSRLIFLPGLQEHIIKWAKEKYPDAEA